MLSVLKFEEVARNRYLVTFCNVYCNKYNLYPAGDLARK